MQKALEKMWNSIKSIPIQLNGIVAVLQEMVHQISILNAAIVQLYGEVNRLRLMQSGLTYREKARIARKIEQFDKKFNGYDPFFASKKAYDNYKAIKNQRGSGNHRG